MAQVPELLECLKTLGVETCTDVRYMWKTGEACCQVVEEHTNRKDGERMRPLGLPRPTHRPGRVAAGDNGQPDPGAGSFEAVIAARREEAS